MRSYIIIILAALIFTSCDCVQQATGVVVDRQTKKPIDNVSLGKYEKEGSSNPYSVRDYTDNKGKFDYHSIGGGFPGCEDLVLYFNKKGYKPAKMVMNPRSESDTVYLDKDTVNQ
jgi:hypothetical protein